MRVENLKKQESVVESVLFTMGQSVEIRQLAAALESDEETAIQAVAQVTGVQVMTNTTTSAMKLNAQLTSAKQHFSIGKMYLGI